ncbi:hypothetical protein BBH99_20680 [Chryseobacterium contaminans]|uniref:Lumazine-binding n=1 Tax=Chryseobacterium contaminans TaxID=1423959 RepID=A0A1M7F1E6_9FLAO|nr:hypothetical protein [Chryseobacterium contaminans]OCA78769.1 hypothetical protein BBH99_20680 [Chryseobacterium contaminans]SHL97509.1 hypothetical protein SAMN05444407_10822 [Chryseobacterium contaminans]
MKNNFIYTLLLLLCSFGFFNAQTAEDKKEVSVAVTDILKGFQTKNGDLMNKYVNETYGVGVLFTSSSDLGFVSNEDVDFSMPLGYIKKAWNIRNQFPIEFDTAFEYDLKNKKWKKEGLSVQFNSNVVNDYADKFSELYAVKDQPIFKINSDPKNVVFITLAENSKENAPVNGFRFVMTKIDGKWFLTFIDVTEYDAE